MPCEREEPDVKYPSREGFGPHFAFQKRGSRVDFEGSGNLLIARCTLHFRKQTAGGGEAWFPPVSAEKSRAEQLQGLQDCAGEPGSRAQAGNDPLVCELIVVCALEVNLSF